ncbi:hypothetical protein F383_35857 [Gossypium arboreum]|uniref:Uncharacterized protein n=1 Tax=Gossypium arboreum TaxID=29729 RepID=A0A0B0NBW4_GOSAR|nr:hypothetical protein F383_35857 [Gossypium arboreum]
MYLYPFNMIIPCHLFDIIFGLPVETLGITKGYTGIFINIVRCQCHSLDMVLHGITDQSR